MLREEREQKEKEKSLWKIYIKYNHVKAFLTGKKHLQMCFEWRQL